MTSQKGGSLRPAYKAPHLCFVFQQSSFVPDRFTRSLFALDNVPHHILPCRFHNLLPFLPVVTIRQR